jgi:hypothetical protein
MKTEQEYIKAETDKYMRTDQYKKEHDAQSIKETLTDKELREKMLKLFDDKQLKIIDDLAKQIFGDPKKK